MDFEKKVPEWDNVGAEPDAQLKKEGFKAGYKPPAAYFNWFFNRISEVAKELQEKAGNEIDNKPDASGGDISDTVITSAEEPKDDYPVPAAGDSTKVFLGKTRKFFGDIKNWMTGVCLLGQIVNNCVTDNAKLPLSAAQGKALMDLYNVLNTNQQISDISYIKSNDNVEFERLYLAQHGHVVTLTSSFKLKKAIPQESYDIIVVGCLPQEMYPILETWFLVGEQGTNKAHMGRIRTSGQIELWCWGADALKIDFVFAFSTTFLTK